jgi:peptidoglycan/LPS O-acetylase OafA/YrhL
MLPARGYRNDVDGLRGLAVLLVLLYHLRVPGFGGGFVGVDVFFVISGFVVTRMILGELAAGSFSFGRFYLRRFWRLMPAFILVALATLLASSLLLAPDDLYRAARSALAALTFSANFHFWWSTAGYATPAAENEPFLHTWSLAVEEQFYLLWPALLWVGARVRLLRRAPVLLAALAGLLALSQWLALKHPSAAYYLLPARLVELALGASLVRTESLRVPRLFAELLAVTGLVAILAASALLDQRSVFPGLRALLPCGGAALLLLVGPSRPLVTRAFELRFAVLAGRVSYSYYLWHWPAVALLHYTGVSFTPSVQLLVASGALLLAVGSYRFWEAPTRGASSPTARRLALAMGIGLLAVVGLTLRPGSRAQLAAQELEKKRGAPVNYRNVDCLFEARTWKELDACDNVVPKRHRKRVLIWGDSHAREWGKALRRHGGRLNVNATTLSVGGCPPLLGVHRADRGEGSDKCDEGLTARTRDFLQRFEFDAILVVARFGLYERGYHRQGQLALGREHFISDGYAGPPSAEKSAQALYRRLPDTLRYLTRLEDTKVVFVLPTPDLPEPENAADKDNDVFLTRAEYLAQRAAIERVVKSLRLPSLHVFDAIDALCGEDECHAVGDEGRLYWDNNHLSEPGMLRLFPQLASYFAD